MNRPPRKQKEVRFQEPEELPEEEAEETLDPLFAFRQQVITIDFTRRRYISLPEVNVSYVNFSNLTSFHDYVENRWVNPIKKDNQSNNRIVEVLQEIPPTDKHGKYPSGIKIFILISLRCPSCQAPARVPISLTQFGLDPVEKE